MPRPRPPGGPERVVVTIDDGAPIPTGDYRLHVQSPDPPPPDLPYYLYYMYYVRIPYFVPGIRDEAGNPLEGGPTSTIAPPDSNDYAGALVVPGDGATRPRAVAPARPIRLPSRPFIARRGALARD